MVIDTTNAERDSANRMAQALRLEAGELGEVALKLANDREIRAGDSVIFSAIEQLDRDLNAYGRRIENGTTASVVALAYAASDRSNTYAAERGEQPGQYAAERGETSATDFGAEAKVRADHAPPRAPNVAVLQLHEPSGDRQVVVNLTAPLELAYARHVYKAQGATFNVPSVATGRQTSLEKLYVMLSRGRDGTELYALRSELEDMGVEAEALAELEARSTEYPAEQTARERAASFSEPQTAAELKEAEVSATPEPVTAVSDPQMDPLHAEQTSERAKIERDLAHIRERLSRPGDYHPAVRDLDQELATKLKQVLAQAERPAEDKGAALPEVRSEPIRTTAQLPEPVQAPAAEVQQEAPSFQAQLMTAQLLRAQKVEKATILEIADRAKSEAKQAAGDRPWNQPISAKTEADQGIQEEQSDRPGHREDYREDRSLKDRRREALEKVLARAEAEKVTRQLKPDELRDQTRQRIEERGREHTADVKAEATSKAANRAPAAMPARNAQESIARNMAERGDHEGSLALYKSMDRLDMVEHPEQHVAEHAARTGGLVIAQNREQQARIQNLIKAQEKAAEKAPAEKAASQPPDAQAKQSDQQGKAQVLLAGEVYQARSESRQAWLAQTRAAEAEAGRSGPVGHHVEPGAIDKATVVVADPKDTASVVRGTSGATEANVVTGQADETTTRAVEAKAAQYRAQQAAHQKAEGQRQAQEAARAAEERSAQAARSRGGAERSSTQQQSRQTATSGASKGSSDKGASREGGGGSNANQGAEHQGAEP
jgi:hypothetical protein